jgi:hypothetical protein
MNKFSPTRSRRSRIAVEGLDRTPSVSDGISMSRGAGAGEAALPHAAVESTPVKEIGRLRIAVTAVLTAPGAAGVRVWDVTSR